MANVRVDTRGPVMVVTIDRPEVRNAVDGPTAAELADAFKAFATDDDLLVGVLTGADGCFCAGADLKAMTHEPARANRIEWAGGEGIADGPMGPTRLILDKPVVAAVEGYAVAGGLELALWCDLRVAARDATFGVFDRRWGVPLIDGGNVRLPRLIGQSRALDLILTGRAVGAPEAFEMGLVNRLCDSGAALETAVELANEIARYPQMCMRADRRSVFDQWDKSVLDAMADEFRTGVEAVASGEAQAGAARFAAGRGRHGDFEDI
jgi:enoyl-CoA hydratase